MGVCNEEQRKDYHLCVGSCCDLRAGGGKCIRLDLLRSLRPARGILWTSGGSVCSTSGGMCSGPSGMRSAAMSTSSSALMSAAAAGSDGKLWRMLVDARMFRTRGKQCSVSSVCVLSGIRSYPGSGILCTIHRWTGSCAVGEN